MTDAEIKKIFGGKRITLMGLGLLGRGIGDAEFFAEAGAELIVTDLKSGADLGPSMMRLAGFPNIAFHLGGHRMEDFENRDLIVRANNARFDSPYLARARERGIPVEMDASLFAKLSGASLVGVTGTRGKSTVTHLIFAIAKAAGRDPLLGGNERGMATLPLVRETAPGRLAVLELDSWQLQGFAEDRISPHIAVWNNFMPDHMDYYRGDMDRYFEDKAAIARFQKPGDVFIAPPEIAARAAARFGAGAADIITDAALPADWKIALAGEHNRANAGFTLAAARALGIVDEVSRKALENFRALPGRLEPVGEKDGIAFYNDSNATTPEAALAALRALAPAAARRGGGIVLIAGGNDKQLSLEAFAEAIPKAAKAAVLIKGTATEKMRALLPAGYRAPVAESMEEALREARGAAEPGDIVLLSPGAASFGVFKNEYDRGDQFRNLVSAGGRVEETPETG